MLELELKDNNGALEMDLGQAVVTIKKEEQEKSVFASKETVVVIPDVGKVLSKVIVQPVTSDIDENIVARNIRSGVSILGVSGDLQPDKPDQEKSVVPTKERQEVVADSGYELAKTIVESIPDNFIEPSGTLEITDNGTYDVKNYENVAVNISLEGENKLAKLVSGQDVELTASDLGDITTILQYSFYYNTNLVSIEFPNTLTSIERNAFYSCKGLTEIEIPASVTSIARDTFNFCSNIKKVVYKGQVPWIRINTFASCTSIMLFDFRNCTKVPSLESYLSFNYASGCQIVVPDELYDSWKAANQWSSLTNIVWVKASEYVEA